MAFNSQSQAIAALGSVPITVGPSQQQTLPAGTIYGAILVLVGWEGSKPTQPLLIEVRHGAGAATGGGTLDAQAAIPIARLSSKALTRVQAIFPSTFTSTAIQYTILFRSGSLVHRWVVARYDMLSGQVSGLTTANVEAQGIGGSTDSYVDSAGTPNSRFDIPTKLISDSLSRSFVLPSASAELVDAA